MKTYSRCELGKRCILKTKNNFVFQKFTMVVAIITKGIIDYEIYSKVAINKDRFSNFLARKILKLRRKRLIIFDNAKTHNNKQITTLCNSSKHSYLFTVPYRPETNAI